jgi:hypothetical protein
MGGREGRKANNPRGCLPAKLRSSKSFFVFIPPYSLPPSLPPFLPPPFLPLGTLCATFAADNLVRTFLDSQAWQRRREGGREGGREAGAEEGHVREALIETCLTLDRQLAALPQCQVGREEGREGDGSDHGGGTGEGKGGCREGGREGGRKGGEGEGGLGKGRGETF